MTVVHAGLMHASGAALHAPQAWPGLLLVQASMHARPLLGADSMSDDNERPECSLVKHAASGLRLSLPPLPPEGPHGSVDD